MYGDTGKALKLMPMGRMAVRPYNLAITEMVHEPPLSWRSHGKIVSQPNRRFNSR